MASAAFARGRKLSRTLYPYFTHSVPASARRQSVKLLPAVFSRSKNFSLFKSANGGSYERPLARVGKRDILRLLSRPFRGLRGEVVRSGRVESVSQESAQKILSLSFKTITYCARIRLSRVRISLISRD